MGVHLWMVAIGVGTLFHAGYWLMTEKQIGLASAVGAEDVDAGFTTQVFWEVLFGAMVALWGGVGDFKPIRIADSKKPRWESLHARQDFHTYHSRARQLRTLLESRLPPVPAE
mmetsp:Transcript_40624/g.111802  ORF Transcript_40624/g.111802 Transcript_40624/m.111802 type:complete len:113 (-) Transcript_40624:128-466(-)